MGYTRDDVIQAVARLFGEAEQPSVLAILDQYGAAPHERECERVQLALVNLSAGDRDTLVRLMAVARQDYRDILCWAQTGPLSDEEGGRLQAAARQLLDRWRER